MPASGDQHRDTPASVNPFVDNAPRITEFTAQEIATLQSRLEKQLGPEYISTRPGNGGGKVHYLAAEKVINLANEVFGFNGWSSSIQNVQIDFVDENAQTGRINLGLSTIVRVTLRDGTFHEDIGYGHCENTKGKAAAFEKAKKEAATDAMKRALRNFGNVLGNCLYDKDYLQKIAKVKVAPSKWDAENLHRHPDFAPIKKEPVVDAPRQAKGNAIQRNTSVQSVQSATSFGSAEFEDDFGGNEFDETDFSHPDEMRVDDSVASNAAGSLALHQNGQRQGIPRTTSMPHMRPPNVQAPPQIQAVQAPQKPQSLARPPMNASSAKLLPPQAPGNIQRPPQTLNDAPQQNANGSRSNPSSGSAIDTQPNSGPLRQPNNSNDPPPAIPDHDEEGFPIPRPPPEGVPGGFVTGRKADVFNQTGGSRAPLAGNIAFNPHAESPSIRRTHGVNPGKSAPVSRVQVTGSTDGAAQPPQQQPQGAGGFQNATSNGLNTPQRPTSANFVNPAADANRKIGMPGAPGPMQNRSAYKPPTTLKRPVMADITNVHGTESPVDTKRAKVDGDGNTPAGDQHAVAT